MRLRLSNFLMRFLRVLLDHVHILVSAEENLALLGSVRLERARNVFNVGHELGSVVEVLLPLINYSGHVVGFSCNFELFLIDKSQLLLLGRGLATLKVVLQQSFPSFFEDFDVQFFALPNLLNSLGEFVLPLDPVARKHLGLPVPCLLLIVPHLQVLKLF